MSNSRPPQVELPHDIELLGAEPLPTPRRADLRRRYLYEIEFFDAGDGGDLDQLLGYAGAALAATHPEAAGKLLDLRLQRAISAAANGWVVERYRS